MYFENEQFTRICINVSRLSWVDSFYTTSCILLIHLKYNNVDLTFVTNVTHSTVIICYYYKEFLY